jgi:SRSO17 transposase
VVADAGYGVATEFREGLAARRLAYAVGIGADVSVWPPGQQPLPAPKWSGQGRPRKRLRRSATHRPLSVLDLATQQPEKAWSIVRWREGTKGTMSSRFTRLRVRPAHRDYWRAVPRAPEWLLVEWPIGEREPTKYWLAAVPENVPLDDLVRLVKIRWRIERDYQELKDELGLDHYEGRGWEGFHHHGVLCIAAYAFLAAERARLPPQHLLPSSIPLAYPKASGLAELPVRPERHNPTSITTMRCYRARSLILNLPSCPWCGTEPSNFVTRSY